MSFKDMKSRSKSPTSYQSLSAEMEKLMEAYHGNIAMTEAHSSRLELEMLLAAERKLSNSLLIQVRHFIQSHRCPPGTI